MKRRKKDAAPSSTPDVIRELFSKVVTLEGRRMSMREGMLRGQQNAAIGGDMAAAVDLQKLRDINGVEDGQVAGVLLLPIIPPEQWERMVMEQQAPFREKGYGKEGF